MFKMIVGHSTDVDSEDAISSVLAQCTEQLQGQQPQAGILLSAIDFEHSLILSRILDAFPEIALMGGTTDGEMSSVRGFQEDSLVLILFCSDTVEIRAGLGRGLSKDAIAAADQSITSLGLEDLSQTKLCLVISDGVEDGTETALRALQKLLPEGVPIVGGRAGDQFQIQNTYQFFQGEVLQNGLSILLFCGDLKVSHGVASGWQPLSRKATITKAEGSTIYEIDNQPATDFYREYIGDLPISAEYPLAVFEEEDARFYLRSSNHWNLETGSILFMGEMPEQSVVQITYATCDHIVAAAQDSIEQAIAHYPGQQPAATLIFSCAARRWLLGHRTSEEYELSKQSTQSATPIGGFYTYGEVGPLKMGGDTCYHQETLVTVMLGTE